MRIEYQCKEEFAIERISLKQTLLQAKANRTAIGAFNIFNVLSAEAVIHAAETLGQPVILQTSVATVRHIGCEELFCLINVLRKQASVPVLLHLDHCREAELAIHCIDVGWDSVMIDGSALPFKQNAALTRSVAEYAHAHDCEAEGELGTISGVEEEIQNSLGQGADYEHSIRFLRETGVDAFAPAIGTAHGLYHAKPELDYLLVERLAEDTPVPVVIHGGTGLDRTAFQRLIQCGASKINVSTALKVGYLNAMRDCVSCPAASDPLAADACLSREIRRITTWHLHSFLGRDENVSG